MRDHNSDMGGTCPQGLGAPECIGGPKWSANGGPFFFPIYLFTVAEGCSWLLEPMFMLHHSVR